MCVGQYDRLRCASGASLAALARGSANRRGFSFPPVRYRSRLLHAPLRRRLKGRYAPRQSLTRFQLPVTLWNATRNATREPVNQASLGALCPVAVTQGEVSKLTHTTSGASPTDSVFSPYRSAPKGRVCFHLFAFRVNIYLPH